LEDLNLEEGDFLKILEENEIKNLFIISEILKDYNIDDYENFLS